MKNKYTPSKPFLVSLCLVFIIFLVVQVIVVPNVEKTSSLAATIRALTEPVNSSSIYPSKRVPGTFIFNWNINKSSGLKGDMWFDASIIPFNEEKARNFLEKEYGHVDFGEIRDAWGYPVRENTFMEGVSNQLRQSTPKQSLNPFRIETALAYDADPNNLGIYNCRANTSVTGYFKAYFEDVALDNNIGFDDPTHGDSRRQIACQALQDISELVMLNVTTVKPDVLFMRSDTPVPPGALAAASAYYNNQDSLDNGTLHGHIITRQDPTPQPGFFDAFIMTNFNGITWSSDAPLALGVFDMHTVMTHELLHAMGFRGLLPAVVPQTNTPHTHGTFDYFSYQNETLQNPFINHITKLLNVPTGAPSPWFISNQAVYRGVKNILNTTPDGVRPVYSPTPWQQGSSLSHFDMNRAPGEVYVMHSSITSNTERDIHEHEKEVLCHLGYMVQGMTGCETPSPVAVDDFVMLNGANSICILMLLNDVGFAGGASLILNSLTPLSLEPGDVIQYYANVNCTNSQPNASGARSILLTPTSDPSSRIIEYTNRHFNTGRISQPAKITTIPSCESTTDLNEYVCNGGFEIGTSGPTGVTPMICADFDNPGNISYWCQYWGSPDRVLNSSTNNPSNPNSGQFASRNVWFAGNSNKEAMTTKLKSPLTQGQEYILSFDYLPRVAEVASPVFGLNNEAILGDPDDLMATEILPAPEQIIFNETINNAQSEWYGFEQVFIPDNSYEYLVVYGRHSGWISGFDHFHYFDNISIRPVNTPPPGYSNQITGTIYQDLNQNGSWQQSTESGLSGIPVQLFEPGNTTPIQTVTTEGLPNTGRYTFNNLEDGTYYVALQGENIYPLITEPTPNSLLPGYNHARSVTISNGQTVENQNFGVALTGDSVFVYGCTDPSAFNYNPEATVDDGSCEFGESDVAVRKSLTDSTVTLLDRQVTWRVSIHNNGPETATNINILETLPQGFSYVAHQVSNQSYTFSLTTSIFHIPSLAPGQQAHLDIVMRVPLKVCGVRVNTATLVSLDQEDTEPGNNESHSEINITSCVGGVTSVSKSVGNGIKSVVSSVSNFVKNLFNLDRDDKKDEIIGVLRIQHLHELDIKTNNIITKEESYFLDQLDRKSFELKDVKVDESMEGVVFVYNRYRNTLTPANESQSRKFDLIRDNVSRGGVENIDTLVFLIQFENSVPLPSTATDFEELLFTSEDKAYLTRFFGEMSHGKVNITGDVFGWHTFSGVGTDYSGWSQQCFLSAAQIQDLADFYEVDISEYQRVITIANCADYGTIGGAAYGSSELGVSLIRTSGHHSRLSIEGFSGYLFDEPLWNLIHEMGHTMGVGSMIGHADSLDCNDKTVWVNCSSVEYGNPFSVMGHWSGRIFNFVGQEKAGWINSDNILEIHEPGNYFINNLQSEDGIVAAKIHVPGISAPVFAVEHRKAQGFDLSLQNNTNVTNGLLLYSSLASWNSSPGTNWRIVDPNPTELPIYEDLVNDAITESFYDEVLGVGINILSVTNDGIHFSVSYDSENSICAQQPFTYAICAPFIVLEEVPNLQAFPSTNSNGISFLWDQIPNVNRYKIYISMNDDFSNSIDYPVNSGDTTSYYLDLPDGSGNTYFAKIQGCFGNFCGPLSEAISVYLPSYVETPSNLVAVADPNSPVVHLSWEDNSDYEQGFQITYSYLDGITSYDGQGQPIMGGQTLHFTTQSNVTNISIVGLPNKVYDFKVRAFVGASYSPYSNIASVTTSDSEFGPPILQAFPSTNSNGMLFVWDQMLYANSYWIQLSLNDDYYSNSQTYIVNDGSIGNYFIAGLVPGNTYFTRIRACLGDYCSPFSEGLDVYLPIVVNAPSNFVAMPDSNSPTTIHLTWEDNSDNEGYFSISSCRIPYTVGNTGVYHCPNPSLNQLPSKMSQSNTTSNFFDNLEPDTTYYFTIRSFANGAWSSFSNIATATTSP